MLTSPLNTPPQVRTPLKRMLINDTAELIQRILASHHSVEQIFIQYFRAHPHLGKRDRRAVLDYLMYAFRLFRLFVDQHPQLINNRYSHSPFKTSKAFMDDLTHWLISISPIEQPTKNIESVPLNLPDWLWQKMLDILPEKIDTKSRCQYAYAMAESYCQRASLDIRINHWRSNLQQVAHQLSQDGYQVSRIDAAPFGLCVSPKLANIKNETDMISSDAAFSSLYHHPLWQEGVIEIQNRASQWVVEALSSLPFNRSERNIWVDYCAGSGGKTLAMATKLLPPHHKSKTTHNTSPQTIAKPLMIVCDTSPQRLQQLKARVAKAQLTAVHIESILLPHTQSKPSKTFSEHPTVSAPSRLTAMRTPEQRYMGRANVVLVDAPCSGLGTLRRSPEIPWRLSPTQLQNYAQQQLEILINAAKWVKPNGFLLYATCSWSPNENSELVQNFMNQQNRFIFYPLPFAPDSVLWQKTKKHASTFVDSETKVLKSATLSVNPLTHQSDGFFMALMQRIK